MLISEQVYYSAEIVRVLNETQTALTPGGGINTNLMIQFAQENGVLIVLEINPSDFDLWKTNGDGRTVHLSNRVAELNETMDQMYLIVGFAPALRDNRNAVDGIDVVAPATRR